MIRVVFEFEVGRWTLGVQNRRVLVPSALDAAQSAR